MFARLLSYYDRFMHERYARPRGRSLYVYCAEGPLWAIRIMFTQWLARLFPPMWIYEVWTRPLVARDMVGGDTYGYFLHLDDAERTVAYLHTRGVIAGWTQHSLTK